MRFKCTCAYDGTDFQGWQRQPDGSAVQNLFERALSDITDREIEIHGSGRTDAGVHARGQVFHFDADWKHDGPTLVRALHARLPQTVSVRSIRKVDSDFHARYSATGKRYRYHLVRGRANPFETRYAWSYGDVDLDLSAMHAAAAHLTGEHDYSAFGATARRGTGEHAPNPVKRVWQLELTAQGRHLTLTAEGSGFLYRMVRSFAGALFEVGRGRLTPAALADILASRKRTQRIITAPAEGLCLERVFYAKKGGDA